MKGCWPTGLKNIFVIRGYQAEKINLPDVQYFVNPEYENNNILESLFYAQEEICDDVVILYYDILFETKIIEKLLESNEKISDLPPEN